MALAQAKRMLARHGEDVTLTTTGEGAVDDYGDPAESTTSSTLRAIRDAGRTTERRTVRTTEGEEVLVDETFFVAGDATLDADPATGRAPELTVDGETFQVLLTRPEGGFTRVECRRQRQ